MRLLDRLHIRIKTRKQGAAQSQCTLKESKLEQEKEDIASPTIRELTVVVNPNNKSTMATTPSSHSPTAPLSLFVLLPASAHSSHTTASGRYTGRPSPLVSRQSGSTVPSLQSFNATNHLSPAARANDSADETSEIDKVVNAGRRLSLAPGIGSGTQTRTRRSIGGGLETIHATSGTPSSSYSAVYAEPQSSSAQSSTSTTPSPTPAFGAKSSSTGRRGRGRPSTAASPASALTSSHAPISRGSFAVPSSSGISGKTRPGWEGDQVVGTLRGSGMEVTIIRHAAQIPSILRPSASSPQLGAFNQQPIAARPATPTLSITPVILVPLSDSPTIPSLSLLLQQGTTPTAVCFQQDLLDRAKRSEDEWLPAALQQIRQVTEMRDQAITDDTTAAAHFDLPIVLAYSANPALSASTISACVAAGASGVLKPPFDSETARLVRRMVRAAKEGRISSVVGLGHHSHRRSSTPDAPTLHKVVLPPTALSMGGEHAGEKVLSDAIKTHRRGTSASFGEWASAAALVDSGSRHGRSREASVPARKQSIHNAPSLPLAPSVQSATTPVTAKTATFAEDDAREVDHFASLLVYNPAIEQRRRSVDIAGLGVALRRAQKAFESAKVNARSRELLSSHRGQKRLASGRRKSASSQGDQGSTESKDEHDEEGCAGTHLAELLSAMYYQTQIAIRIQMDGYEAYAEPISQEHRERLIDAAATWDFKPHFLDEVDLFRLACLLFEGLLHSEGLIDLALEQDQVKRLLFAIRAIYHAPNPYHNYVHAIDVVQATYSFLVAIGVAPPFSYIRNLGPDTPAWKRPAETDAESLGPGTRRARQVFRPQDVFAILLAAMGHDVGHPGLSNAFMKNAKTPLSQVYEDKSVLENMHCMLIVQLVRKHGFGFLLNSGQAAKETIPARARFDTKGFRRVLYSSVLATDMSLHFVWMQELQKYGEEISHEDGVHAVKNAVRPGEAEDDMAESDRVMIAQALIKCADISNPTRPIDVSEHWSSVLLKEWAVQASLETDLSLPVSVIASADAALQAKGQIGFIKLFTQPLFDAVSDVLPELQCYADWCASNHELWEGRSERLKESESTEIVQPAVEDAACDERFATLFPLSLPISLVESRNLEPGPLPGSPGDEDMVSSAPQTPLTTPRKVQTIAAEGTLRLPESPSAKAIRAVYHANLLDQRHRLSSWTRGVPIPGLQSNVAYLAQRRSSTPSIIPHL